MKKVIREAEISEIIKNGVKVTCKTPGGLVNRRELETPRLSRGAVGDDST